MNAILLKLTQRTWLLASKQLMNIECLDVFHTFIKHIWKIKYLKKWLYLGSNSGTYD